ncbi:MAG: hypothetical protein JXB39_06915, partial [Deltaproteobacteria bacterium]|nr:hypothetical protein [Deltaproteobacteria bacterium]
MRRLPPQRPRVSVRPLSLLGAGARGAGCTALLALGGTACDDRAPDRFSDCPDSPCRVEWVLSRLESEPQSALDAILVVPDGVERSLLVGVVVDRHPEMSGFLCDKLAPGADREIACDTTDRPHIWARLGPPGPILPRPGGGPSSTTLVPSVSFGPSPFPLEPLDGHPCAGRLDGVTCLLAQARQSAAVGDTQRATRACMTIASDRWRAECFFQVAEVASDDRSPSQYGEPIRLCALSGPFSPQCFAHLAMKPALLAPRA